jgi:hypothetical protein
MTFGSPVTGSNYFHDRSQSITFTARHSPQRWEEAPSSEGIFLGVY